MPSYLISLVGFLVVMVIFLVRFLRARHPCRGILGIGTGSPFYMRENRRAGQTWKQFPLRKYHSNRIVLKEADLPEGVRFKKVVITCPTDRMSAHGQIHVRATRPRGDLWEATLSPKMLLNTEREEWFYKDPFLRDEPESARAIFVDLRPFELIGWSLLILLLGGLSFYLWWFGL